MNSLAITKLMRPQPGKVNTQVSIMSRTTPKLMADRRRTAPTPTGLLLDAAPYGAMLALAAGSGAVFFRKRRRED